MDRPDIQIRGRNFCPIDTKFGIQVAYIKCKVKFEDGLWGRLGGTTKKYILVTFEPQVQFLILLGPKPCL